MDIQRKGVPQPKKNAISPQYERVVPEFFSGSKNEFPVLPKGPYQLGEEQLWYQPETPPHTPIEHISEEHIPAPLSVPPQPSRPKQHAPKRISRPRLSSSSIRKGAVLFAIALILLFGYGLMMKSAIQKNLASGLGSTQEGMDQLGEKNFVEARAAFLKAERNFQTAKLQTLYFPTWATVPFTLVPGVSKLSSGILVIDASSHLNQAALTATLVLEKVSQSRNKVEGGEPVSYLGMLEELQTPLKEIRQELKKAERSLSVIPARDIPENRRMTFELLQTGVPGIIGGIDSLLANTPLIEELLGKNGPRIYLFLFQNNQELRPTGGFIGTYGILEFKNGHARRFFIDGIFNPDGQLKENIIPPKPIQKISAGWSLHDSNWFPDFPTSAEKAIYFYEKTGGPTVDGVFTLTPTVMERLFSLTGPIALPEYEMVVDSKNFIPTIQEQVEVKYDRVENKPKKVLADLASILLEKVFAITDPVALYSLADIFVTGMNEKQILLYTRNSDTQAMIESAGWSGKIENSTHDYLSVINTNINGYKTDGVIEDSIDHTVTVQADGTLVAKTKITREHQGGNTPYEWWNRVNSNYMRVYVPKGSKLIQATGHTREFPESPLDYKRLGFEEDQTVLKEEQSITIHEATGTRVGEEFEKTVFGNWVYVSPGEAVSVEYTYLLPFRLDPLTQDASAYALLFQKQPGSDEVNFRSRVEYPESWEVYWTSDDLLLQKEESGIQLERTLRSDAFWGVVFRK